MTLTLRRLVPALRCAGLGDEEIASGRQAQSVVYLLERAGAHLGYRYGWEMFGPFSEGLAETLNEATHRVLERCDVEPTADVCEAAQRLERVRTARPDDVDAEIWLRLVAAVDFLETRAKVPLENGSTPRYLQNFARPAIRAAQQARRELEPAESASAA